MDLGGSNVNDSNFSKMSIGHVSFMVRTIFEHV